MLASVYASPVTAAASSAPVPRGPSLADAPPAVVRAALIPEDVPRFDQQWREAMAAATRSLDLTEVHRLLESWRRVAQITAALGHDRYRRMLARAEHTLRTGELPAGSMSADEVTALIAQRLR